MVHILSEAFCSNFYGHQIQDLTLLVDFFRESKPSNHSLIFLAGDSSFDNKAYFTIVGKAPNGYQNLMNPPELRKDVAYWMNFELEQNQQGDHYTVINAAVEESSIGSRSCCRMQSHDSFIQQHVSSNDIVIVSVGGNDVALFPNPCTICNVCCLLYCTHESCFEACSCGTALPCDDYCCGCCSSFLSNFLAFPFGFGYFIHLFRSRVEAYVSRLINLPFLPLCCYGSSSSEILNRIPKKVMVSMIYYVSMTLDLNSPSWADNAMAWLGYNSHPGKLQLLTRKIYEHSTRRLVFDPYVGILGHWMGCDQIKSCLSWCCGPTCGCCCPSVGEGERRLEVVSVPLFVALDGKNPKDYIQRVEPSSLGGKRIASLLLEGVLHGQTGIDAIIKEKFKTENI